MAQNSKQIRALVIDIALVIGFSIAITTGILFASPSFAANSSTKQQSARETQADIQSAVASIAKKSNIPSLGLAISMGDQPFQYHYHNPDVEPQSLYGIASVTKLLSTVLAMHYVEQQRLNLHAKVTDYLNDEALKAEGINAIAGAENITVNQLLTHTSGLADYANNPTWPALVFGENKAPSGFEEKIKLVDKQLISPGSFHYSNSNFLVLEQVVEHVSGLSYQAAFAQYFKQQGANITLTPPDNTLQAFFAQTDKHSNNVSQIQEHYGFDGGAYTTPKALLQLLSQLFIRKNLLSESSLTQLQEWTPMSPKTIPIGSGIIAHYGKGLMRLTYRDSEWIGHMGGSIKYQSFAFYHTASQTIVVMMTNASGRHYNNAFFQKMVPAVLDNVLNSMEKE